MVRETDNQAVETKTEIAPLTMEIAKHYDRMSALKGDRDPDTPRGRARVAWLFGLLRAGLFHSPVWSEVKLISSRATKEKRFRVDGGHSSRMLVQSGPDFPQGMKVTLRHFEAENMHQVIYLYEQFNSQMSTRTTIDLVKNRKAYIPEISEIAPTDITRGIYGIAFHLGLHNPNEEYKPLDLIEPYSEFLAWCAEFAKSKVLRRPGTVGAIFAMYAHDEASALKFWRMVRDGTGTMPTCPTRVLGKFLAESDVAHGLQPNSSRKWSQRAFYVKCHHAWNAWRNNTGTALKYIEGAPLPTLI